jgi:two-component system KDP operon response regulator KdpE
LRVVLHAAGFEVDATRTAAAALDRGAVRAPTAAIIELVLPDGDGVQVCRRPRELVARLLANLRRADPGRERACVRLDGLEIDLAARVVRRDGEVVHLTPIEFKLLGALTQNRGRLLTHNALLAQVWGAAYTDVRSRVSALPGPTPAGQTTPTHPRVPDTRVA